MRTFQDRNFLVWEAYPSAGRHGSSAKPHVIFHCLTQPDIRPRFIEGDGSGTEAQRRIAEASPDELLLMLESAAELA
jgi:hypothetical protein